MFRPLVLLTVTLMLSLASLPGAQSGSSIAPEMPDKTGDVDPLSLVGLKPTELEAVENNASMFDIKKAYITGENPKGFWVIIEVVDLNGGLESPQPEVQPPSMIAAFETHFMVGENAYYARAILEPDVYMDPDQSPPVIMPYIASNFTLHHADADDTLIARISGNILPSENILYFYVAKEHIGGPLADDVMGGLYTVSLFGGQALDYAPDATLDPTQVDTEDPLKSLVVPQNGTPYRFGQYPGSGATPKLELAAEGPTTIKAAPGETVELALSVKNLGDKELTVRIGTVDPHGWSVTVDNSELALAAGSSDAFIVTATPTDKARLQGILKVTATTSAETQTVIYALQNEAAGSDNGTDGTDGATGGGPASPTPDQSLDDSTTEDAPGVGLVMIGAVLVAVAVVLRRRH